MAGGQHLRAAVQAHDLRRAFEAAEHDGDPSVLARVRDRLGAAADEVEVRDLPRPEDPEPAEVALGRDVDVAFRVERSGSDEEEVLALDPGGELLVDAVEDLRHSDLTWTVRRGVDVLPRDQPV